MLRTHIQAFTDFLNIQRGYSPRTIKAYDYDLQRFGDFLEHTRHQPDISGVTKQDIFAYLAYLSHQTESKKPISVVTRARCLASIRSFFNYLLEYEVIEKNPAQSINLPQLPQTEPDYLTVQEYTQLITCIEHTATPFFKERDLAIIVLLLSTGIRISEMVGLQLSHVDLENQSIKVTRKRNKEQTIPLNVAATMSIHTYLTVRPDSQDTSLFLSKLRTGIRQNTVFSLVKKYLHRAGLEKSKHGPHLLRHSCFTTLLSHDVNPVIIQNLAGHASFDTTRRYLHVHSKQIREATDKIEINLGKDHHAKTKNHR